MMRPLMFDLFCGVGGATEGFLSAGWDCIGVDIERHVYGNHRYRAQLWIQDILTISGHQLRHADFLWASPPCTEFSYMAMPWKRAKQIALALRGADEFPEGYTGSRTIAELTRLFDACFRIQREACEAAGRHIPMIVENVRGAIPWVGRSRWNFGSFHLWGDVPALMPVTVRTSKVPGFRFDGSGGSFQSAAVQETGVKNPGLNWSKYGDADYRTSGAGACFRDSAVKNNGGSWFNVAHNTTSGKGNNLDGRKLQKPHGGSWFYEYGPNQGARNFSSKSPARKAASAMIAKIPFPLAQYIAATFKPASISNCGIGAR